MNLVRKKEELIHLIADYLDSRSSLEDLQKFAWDVIDYFSEKNTQLPEYQKFENEFWYTIWQIQHLADQEHEKEGITRKVLIEALEYLNQKKSLPEAFVGRRP